MSAFNPKFKQLGSLQEVAQAINEPHDEDLTVQTAEMIEMYTKEPYSFIEWDLRRIHSMIGSWLLWDVAQVGCYRTRNVTVGGRACCDPVLIPDMVPHLFPIEETPEGAADFYKQFQIIHPFMDGNGRVGGIIYASVVFNAIKEWWGPCQ